MYTAVNEIVLIITNSLKSINVCAERIIKSTNDIELKNKFDVLQLTIEQDLVIMNDRNNLFIEHQKSSTLLVEKSSDLFRQGMELLTTYEH